MAWGWGGWGLPPFISTKSAIGTTSTDGFVLTNPTAAAAGAQQISPRLRWTGQGWKTDATAGSQTVDFIAELVPVQGAANPQARLDFNYRINAGAWTNALSILNGNFGIGTTTPNDLLALYSTRPMISFLESDAAANNKEWRFGITSTGEQLEADVVNDARSITTRWLLVDRTGTTIDSVSFPNGNVGIGTTGPSSELQVGNGTDTDDKVIKIVADNTTGDPYLSLLVNGINDWTVGVDNSDSNKFKIGQDGPSASTNYLTIDTSGNAGIATTSFGTSAAKVVSIGAGTAPTTSPADVAQLWTSDVNAVAGQTGFHFRDELGGVYKIGAGILLASNAEPAAAAGVRGTINYVAGGAGVADTLKVCVKSAADTYSWVTLI